MLNPSRHSPQPPGYSPSEKQPQCTVQPHPKFSLSSARQLSPKLEFLRRIHHRQILGILGVSAIPIGIIVLLNRWRGIPVNQLTADPTALINGPFYLGFLSQMGIFVWAAVATIGLFTAYVLRLAGGDRAQSRFFLASGLLSLWLGLDDVFLFHEEAFPAYLGMPEKLIYGIYGGLVLLYCIRFRRFILRSDYTALGVAFVAFSTSIALDIIKPPYLNPYFFEDSSKFVGLVAWLAYFVKTGGQQLSQLWQSRNSPMA